MRKRRPKQPKKPLTEQQKRAALLLFEGGRMGDTAAAVGVHRATLWRWYKRPDFQREINRISAEWQKAYKKKILQELRAEQAERARKRRNALRRLRRAEKRLRAAEEAEDINAIRAALKAHTTAFNEAYGDALRAFGWSPSFAQQKEQKKRREPPKCIIEIV